MKWNTHSFQTTIIISRPHFITHIYRNLINSSSSKQISDFEEEQTKTYESLQSHSYMHFKYDSLSFERLSSSLVPSIMNNESREKCAFFIEIKLEKKCSIFAFVSAEQSEIWRPFRGLGSLNESWTYHS